MCLKEQGPQYIQKCLKLRKFKYNLRSSGTKLEQLLPFQTQWLKHSYAHITSRLCNNLPGTSTQR